MDFLKDILGTVYPILTTAGAVAGVVLFLYVARRLLSKTETGVPGRPFRNQLIMLGLSFAGLLVVIMAMPVGDTTRGQLLSLIGILLSAAIALSSTTLLGNAMAGIMLKAIRNFRTGDFIRVEGHFGRVSERGLAHTEIQTENRDLTTLSNLYLITHPVTVTRSSGTIVAARVSLGYDVQRNKIKKLLLAAAEEAELTDPFVHILDLGDSSVTYRVAGMLADVKQIISKRSRLRGLVMDHLHAGGVEIVSPSFMNQRPLTDGKEFIPDVAVEPAVAVSPDAEPIPEEIVFDKAEEAESVEKLRQEHQDILEEIKQVQEEMKDLEEGARRDTLQRRLFRLEATRDNLAAEIARFDAKDSKTADES